MYIARDWLLVSKAPCYRGLRARLKAEKAAASAARRAATPRRTREQKLAQVREWRAAHPGYMREWRQQNPEKRAAERKRRGKIKRARIVDALMKAQRGRCAYCREMLAADFHVDHIVARARGGSHAMSNLQLTCSPCNLAKGAQDPVAFAQSMGMLV